MKICIVGCGVVGEAYAKAYESTCKVFRHDLKLGTTIKDVEEFAPDLIYLCLPTPANPDGSCSIDVVEKCLASLLHINACIVIKSTIPPGTCDYLVDKYDIDIDRFGHSAEFLKERSAEYDAKNQKILICGTYGDTKCKKMIEVSNEGLVEGEIIHLYPTESELAKYFHNVFNSTRIIYAVQFYKLCEKLGVSYNHVKNAAVLSNGLKDEYLDAGELQGYTGHCLVKDTKCLSHEFKKHGIDSSMIDSVDRINEDLPKTIIGNMRFYPGHSTENCDCEPEYFGEALMGSLDCRKCGSYLRGTGIDFIKTIRERWDRGDRGYFEED